MVALLADPDPDLFWPVLDELVERDPETGCVWTDDDELWAVDSTLGESVEPPRTLGAPAWWVPDLDEAWAGTTRVAARPLAGVTGVAGPDLAERLRGLDSAVLSPAQLVEVITGAERLARWAQSVQLAAVKAFADYAAIRDEDTRDHPLPDLPGGRHVVETGFGTQREIERFCADGIGAALGISYTSGQRLIDTAYFAADAPLARSMLATGRVDVARLQVLARELAPVGYGTVEDRAFVDQQMIEHAGLTPKQLEVRLREAVIARSPADAREVHRREALCRGVWMSKRPGGMAGLHIRLKAEEATLAYQALNAAGWHQHDAALAETPRSCEVGEYRSFDHFRADAFMTTMRDLQMTYLRRDTAGEDPPEPGDHTPAPGELVTPRAEPARSKRAARMMDPARVMLHLYLDAATLAGQSDRPASLLGYGPIGADQARDLAQNATVVRLLTDPFTGQIQAVDLPCYRVPKILRWAVAARDRGCAFPGCDTPGYDTQLDHIDPHPFARKLQKAFATGRTSFTNLQQLCVRHHYLKTHGGWTIQPTNGSRLEWVSPTGHSYRRNPEWGPPRGFWDEHDHTIPIDGPPPVRPSPTTDDRCPF